MHNNDNICQIEQILDNKIQDTFRRWMELGNVKHIKHNRIPLLPDRTVSDHLLPLIFNVPQCVGLGEDQFIAMMIQHVFTLTMFVTE